MIPAVTVRSSPKGLPIANTHWHTPEYMLFDTETMGDWLGMPRDEDLPLLDTDPGKVLAKAYDLTLNGVEMAGGSIRIHRADVQSKVFRLLGIGEQEAHAKFQFLLEALRFGAWLAESTEAPLTIVHVVHDPGEAPGYYHVKGRKKQLRRMEDVAAEMFDEFVSRMRHEMADSKAMAHAKKVLVVGLPVTRVLELVEKLDATMVVMGSRGRTGLARAMLGSKAEHILRLCPVPVTVVKERKGD